MPLLTPDDVRAELPNVGDRLVKQPSYFYGFFSRHDVVRPRPCVVTYVHRRNRWYTVQFESGIKESYKLPEVRVDANGRLIE